MSDEMLPFGGNGRLAQSFFQGKRDIPFGRLRIGFDFSFRRSRALRCILLVKS